MKWILDGSNIMMGTIMMRNAVFVLRLVLACICGGIIGYERKNRGKGAGVRTHIIVAVASALMMIVSKYGFVDITAGVDGMRGADGARIAAQVVSGVGFLGAGMIYFNRNTVQGLTTAAGIWATAGVGLAVGTGMYVLGIASALLILIIQLITHKKLKFMSAHTDVNMTVVIDANACAAEEIKKIFSEYDMVITGVKCKRRDGERAEFEFSVNVQEKPDLEKIAAVFCEKEYIKSINI